MATHKSKGKVMMGVELPIDLDRELRQFCKRRGSKLSDEVRLAIRRHLAHPPPAEVVPGFPAARKRDARRKATE